MIEDLSGDDDWDGEVGWEGGGVVVVFIGGEGKVLFDFLEEAAYVVSLDDGRVADVVFEDLLDAGEVAGPGLAIV